MLEISTRLDHLTTNPLFRTRALDNKFYSVKTYEQLHVMVITTVCCFEITLVVNGFKEVC